MKYRVVYSYTKYEDEIIEANSIEEAKEIWENEGADAELFLIENEDGEQKVFTES